MCGQIGECCSYNFAAESCYTKKLCSRLFSTEVEFYWQKKQNRVLCHALGDLGAGLKVSGLGGAQPPPAFSAAPQLRAEWGGRLRERIRESGKW